MFSGDDTIKKMCQLTDIGIGLAIDDFGIGYSSLANLKHMPIDLLKIDQSFVRDITVDEEDTAICIAIIRMAKSLKLDVIAEGVENIEQLELLGNMECHKIQGYIISKPVTHEEFDVFLNKDWRFDGCSKYQKLTKASS